ncbi:cysteine hydrolase family protein [Amphritea sp. HPY]|uniref:cysteine hydrolase family protein n=1 Tax=Amphritea sp. HPY TaxID=3421652 RepID=UPI003D7C9510
MDNKRTAVLLIGYQNDYFSAQGILHGALEDSSQVGAVLDKTLQLIDKCQQADILLASTPIIFTPDYSELNDPIGILKLIKDNGAFRSGQPGAETIPQLQDCQDLISLPGKRGLNAFSNTRLAELLREQQIEDVIIAGAVTSLCIDTAGREAVDLGFNVTVLSDCTVARTAFEQEYYCNEIMPLYANVRSSQDVIDELGI